MYYIECYTQFFSFVVPYLCHPCMSVLLWKSHIFLIAAVTYFLSCILNVGTLIMLSYVGDRLIQVAKHD